MMRVKTTMAILLVGLSCSFAQAQVISDSIHYFGKQYTINLKHVFVVGTSGGGHMAYKLALTMPTTFLAVTAIIANLPDTTNMDCAISGKPVAVMIINGTEDTNKPLQRWDGQPG